ncbi:hypothetical protein A1O7_09525 [Cladophialophora yegresii CBS 114405]|uniref:Uncharacterized protein n=1 Tax=Cladophialophora yegresii CBS 114405 TaxID=1182544 RepID=W9VFC9_9EURO|nr:uncharacterized protein A1O7_09525 [Cladophialophora yegresii CBS 114405]EXJ54188.1 hypothetical protein A1O7_09525 [Cladophialophora yegresii CBS 114405]
MTSRYSRLNPVPGVEADSSRAHLTESMDILAHPNDVPLRGMASQAHKGEWRPLNDHLRKSEQSYFQPRPTGPNQRKNTGFSIPSVPSSPWEHQLNEKHIRAAPKTTETVRYFDPRRQTRRVFLDCLFMWFWTVGICAALAGTMYGFSTIVTGLTRRQKYVYNALITGLSIVLGLAFAAQFKQYAEMMRWRFLASQYRKIQDFEDVLGCDSYRSALRVMWRGHRRGTWYPSKAQVLATFWILVFVVFNVCTALLGLTYSIDVSDIYVHLSHGETSVADLSYISSQPLAGGGSGYFSEFQKAAANLWGQVGQNYFTYPQDLDDVVGYPNARYVSPDRSFYYYRFVDLSPDQKTNVVSQRTVSSTASCVEYTVTFGGYAGLNTDDAELLYSVQWVDDQGNSFGYSIPNVATGETTWMGNSSSACGPRCAQILALQSANNLTSTPEGSGISAVPTPRMWACNNTVGRVTNTDVEGFEDPTRVDLPDDQAFYLAGAIGWTGIETQGYELQYSLFHGDTPFNPPGDTTADHMAELVMSFTVGVMSASDGFGGPRINLTGAVSPSPAQVVNVKWADAGGILAGIPVVQFVMLLGVVWFASKAIILEPSYMTVAHLLYPVIQKVGKDGCLFTVDEIAERLGSGYRIAYGVRPDPADPGHHDTTFVRDLDVIEESEGHGYIRGSMPEGRYD